MNKVDLNVDIGEGFPHDEALLEFATSANICCGEHAGSWELTTQTIDMCLRKGTRIGSHPGFPDRENFGRSVPTNTDPSVCPSIERQILRFDGHVKASYVKPHGALYQVLCGPWKTKEEKNMFAAMSGCLFGICIRNGKRPFMMLPNSPFAKAVKLPPLMLKLFREGFADRRYTSDGLLVPRTQPDAILENPDEIVDQVLRIAPQVDSICLHGDTPNCLEFAELVNKTLVDAGYEVGY